MHTVQSGLTVSLKKHSQQSVNIDLLYTSSCNKGLGVQHDCLRPGEDENPKGAQPIKLEASRGSLSITECLVTLLRVAGV